MILNTSLSVSVVKVIITPVGKHLEIITCLHNTSHLLDEFLFDVLYIHIYIYIYVYTYISKTYYFLLWQLRLYAKEYITHLSHWEMDHE